MRLRSVVVAVAAVLLGAAAVVAALWVPALLDARDEVAASDPGDAAAQEVEPVAPEEGVATPDPGDASERIRGQLRANGEAVAGVVIVAFDRDGEEVGRTVSDGDGVWSMPLPEEGDYVATLQADTLPEGITLRDPQRGTHELSVRSGQERTLLFPLGTDTAEADARELLELTPQAADTAGDCPPSPEHPLLRHNADCLSVLAADLNGDGRSDRLLLYEQRGLFEPYYRFALAVLATGDVSELGLGTGYVLYPIGVRDLNGDGGDDVLVVVDQGAHARLGAILTFHDGELAAARLADGAGDDEVVLFIEGGGVNHGSGVRCRDDGLVLVSFEARSEEGPEGFDEGFDVTERTYEWATPVELELVDEQSHHVSGGDAGAAYELVRTRCDVREP